MAQGSSTVKTHERTLANGQIKYEIVDADAHVSLPPDFWGDYLPERLRELAPRIEFGDDADYVVFEGRRKKLNLLNSQAGRKGKDFKIEGKVSDI